MKPRPCVVDLDLSAQACDAAADVLTLAGSKWSLLVIAQLSHGSLRFAELKRRLEPVSQKVLTATLRALERDGYLRRHVTPGKVPRVDYELSTLGHELLEPMTRLAMWAISRRDTVAAARERFDAGEVEAVTAL